MARRPAGSGFRGRDVDRDRWSDARLRADAGPGTAGQAEIERRRQIGRQLWLLLLGAVFVAGSVAAVFGDRGLLDVRRSERELDETRRHLHRQVERVRRLRLQVQALREDPTATERIAREELGLARKGEVVFLLPEDPAEGPPESE